MGSATRVRSIIVVALVAAGLVLAPATASASGPSSGPPPPPSVNLAWPQHPIADTPQAKAALLPAFVAATAVRAAFAVRAARAASALRTAAAAAKARASFMKAVTAKKIKDARATAKLVARKGTKWLKKNWGTIGTNAASCLATAAFMEQYKMLRDGKIDRNEWSQYSTFGPRLVPPTETLSINFPITFDRNLEEKVVECAVGMGVQQYFGKVTPK